MIQFIIKNFRIIVDSLIVAAIIIAFSFWDPLGWFKGKTNIKNTPVSLQSVKEIGQLITAEYFGEVVASLKESMIEDYSGDTVTTEVHELFSNMLASIQILKNEDKDNKTRFFNWKGSIKQSNIANKFANRFPVFTENYLYFPLINFLADTLSRSKELNTAGEREEQVLWYFFGISQEKLDKFNLITENKPGYLRNFKNHYHDYRVDSVRSEKIKKEIIYVGRGWVKAGIDFQHFDQTKFWYDQKSKTIYFRKFEPRILDCDINPWFIPERQIKGFELVVATGKIKKPFEDSRKVKMLCKEKLRNQAIKSGILEQAQTNARLSLQRLFSLLMDEPVNDVIFSSGKYQLLLQELIADSTINETESQLISTIIGKDAHNPDSAWYTNQKIQINDLKDFCNDLKKIRFDITGKPFNFFSPSLSLFYKDGILKNDDLKKLSATNNNFLINKDSFEMKTKLFKIWCNLSPDFRQVYDFFNTNVQARNYLQLNPELFSAKNKTQYFLSSNEKKAFLQIIEDKLNTILPKDPDFEALFWFDDLPDYSASLNQHNFMVFELASVSEVTNEIPDFVLPDKSPTFGHQINSILNRKGIKINFE